MTKTELVQSVLDLIDSECDGMSQEIYYDFLGNLLSSLEMREEAVADDMRAAGLAQDGIE